MIFGIAALAVSHTGSAARLRMGRMLAQNAFDELSSKIAESCALGPGNVRTIELSGGNATLSPSSGGVAFSMGGFKSSKSFDCRVEIPDGGPAGAFRVENVDGKIVVGQLS